MDQVCQEKIFPAGPGNEGIMLGFKFTDLFDDAEFTLNWTTGKKCPKIPQLEEKELPEKFRLVKRCVTLIKPAGFFLKGN